MLLNGASEGIAMGKYERLERLIRISTLIRSNMGLSRLESGSVLRSVFHEDAPAKRGHTEHYFAEDNKYLAESKAG